MEMDPLRPVENGCNGFSIVKSVPLPCDYNVLMLLSFHDAVENTALGCCAASGSIFYQITQAKKHNNTVQANIYETYKVHMRGGVY